MLALLILLALPAGPMSAAFTFPVVVPAVVAPVQSATADDAAFEAKLAAAGKDVSKLLALGDACAESGQGASARKAYAKVLELDAANEAAHKGLNHQFYDGRWFESFAELAKFKRDEDAKMKAKGLVRYQDGWAPEADLPYLKMGWTKGGDGTWVNPIQVARAAQAAEWQAAGYEYRSDDDSWIAPDDMRHWADIEWKCGDEWLDMKLANAYHSEIGRWWRVVGEHFTVWTTCDWDKGNSARWYADRIWPDLVRLFGVEPAGRPHFIVLNSISQYNQAAGGTPPLIPESEGSSSVYGAYFADTYFDTSVTPRQYLGAGVSFWSTDRGLEAWGPYFLRWAAAQSYVEAIDPSWKAIAELVASGGQADAGTGIPSFWGEKKVPRWLRYGAASYVERFLRNPEAAEGADPWDIRAYALGELKKAGGLRPLDKVFEFKVNLQDAADAERLYHEAGLVVAFLLDGAPDNKELATRHAAFKEFLQNGSKEDVTAAADALQKTLAKNEKEIRAFAGL